jgi:DnaK suppressor protein
MNTPHMHYFTIEQRESLRRQMEARAAVLRGEVGEDLKADLNAEPEATVLALDVSELREIEAALDRLHEPEFGICADCSADIPFSRLQASPAARRCTACQALAEKG